MPIADATGLTQEGILRIKEVIIEEMLPLPSIREVIPIEDVGDAVQHFEAKRGTALTGGELVGPGGTFPFTEEQMAYITAAMQKPGIAMKFTMEDLKSYPGIIERKSAGMGASILTIEDDVGYNGMTVPPVEGLINATGINTQAATDTWNKAPGTAKPHDDINNAMGKLEEDHFPGPYRLILEHANYKELRKLDIQAGGSGDSWFSEVEGLIGKGNIVKSWTVPHGTGLLIQPGMMNAVMLQAEDLTIDGPYKLPNQTEQVNVYCRTVPFVYRPESICKITGL